MRKLNTLRTAVETAYLYPMLEIEEALRRTNAKVTYNGTNIICNTFADWSAFFYDMWYRTFENYPDRSVDPPITGGYNVGKGTLLEDMNKKLFFLLPSGSILARFELVRQLTPQQPFTVIPSPGLSPPGKIGYILTFVSKFGGDIDPVRVIRV